MIDYLSVKTTPKYEEVDIYDSRNHIHNDSKVSLTFPAEILYTKSCKNLKNPPGTHVVPSASVRRGEAHLDFTSLLPRPGSPPPGGYP